MQILMTSICGFHIESHGVVSIINDDLKGKEYQEEDFIDERSITEQSWPLQ